MGWIGEIFGWLFGFSAPLEKQRQPEAHLKSPGNNRRNSDRNVKKGFRGIPRKEGKRAPHGTSSERQTHLPHPWEVLDFTRCNVPEIETTFIVARILCQTAAQRSLGTHVLVVDTLLVEKLRSSDLAWCRINSLDRPRSRNLGWLLC